MTELFQGKKDEVKNAVYDLVYIGIVKNNDIYITQRLYHYNLVKQGITYTELGYDVPLSSNILEEHALLSYWYDDAIERKHKIQMRKSR